MKTSKEHWEQVYDIKKVDEVSWYQPKPETSLEIIKGFKLHKNDAILDVGGGDSFLAEHLLKMGYTNITVLDISKNAIDRAKKRLGKNAEKINWIETNVIKFTPSIEYKVWHDRATFHFLTEEVEVHKYIKSLKKAISKNGFLVMGTFSEKGPATCSGVAIKQYSLHELREVPGEEFEIIKCENIDHITPTEAIQNFSFCSFIRI